VPNQERKQTVIAGAGPAGLTAAWMLARRAVRPLVLEQDTQVGGLARTVECFEGDGLWTTTDAELLALGARELETIGLLGGAA
jgi:protoporphyrinogen oxidase